MFKNRLKQQDKEEEHQALQANLDRFNSLNLQDPSGNSSSIDLIAQKTSNASSRSQFQQKNQDRGHGGNQKRNV